MNFTKQAPTWDAVGTEPSAQLQTNGFVAGYKPPAAYFNYLFNNYTACIDEIQTLLGDLDSVSAEEIIELQNAVVGFNGSKNMLDYESIKEDALCGHYCTINNSGFVVFNNNTTAAKEAYTVKHLLEAGTYTVSVRGATTSDNPTVKVGRGDTLANIGEMVDGLYTYTFTANGLTTYSVGIMVSARTTNTVSMQIERGDTATEFAIHKKTPADVVRKIVVNKNKTAVGAMALKGTNIADANTAVGYQAGYNVGTGGHNTAVGHRALVATTIGAANTAIGSSTLTGNSTGAANTAIGAYALQGNSTGSNNAALGAYAGLQGNYTNTTLLGYTTAATGSNQVQLGNDDANVYAYAPVQTRCDERDKADVTNSDLGLAFIKALTPRKFRYDYRDAYITYSESTDADGNPIVIETIGTKDGSKKRSRWHYGLTAQELKTAMDSLGVDFGGYEDHTINGGADVKTVAYTELIAPLIKAAQELDDKASDLETDLTEHTESTSNPHNVTAEQLGLENVDNTSDADKPVSTATQDALDLKQDTLVKLATGSNVNVSDSVESTMLLNSWTKNSLQNTATTQTINGVIFTVNADKTVTVNGTATSDARFIIKTNDIIQAGKTYTLSGCPSGGDPNYSLYLSGGSELKDYGEGATFTCLSDYSGETFRIRISSGYTANNLVFKPMLEEGTVAHPYVPYEGYDVTACGKNFFSGLIKGTGLNPTTGAQTSDANKSVTDYIPINMGATISYILWGLTNTLYSYVAFYDKRKTFLGRTKSVYVTNVLLNSNTLTPSAMSDNVTLVLEKVAYVRITQYAIAGTTAGVINDIDNLSIQLENGNNPTSYKQYEAPNTVTVTNDTQAPVVMQSYDGGTNVFTDCGAELEVCYASNNVGRNLLDNMADTYEHIGDTSNPHGVTKEQVGLGNVQNVATNDQTPTYTDASSNTALSSGEKLSTAFGKIAKAISSLISHLANTSNPHNVTPEQLGLGSVVSDISTINANLSPIKLPQNITSYMPTILLKTEDNSYYFGFVPLERADLYDITINWQRIAGTLIQINFPTQSFAIMALRNGFTICSSNADVLNYFSGHIGKYIDICFTATLKS